MGKGAVTLEEWRVPVGSVVVTPTVVQQTVRRWLQKMGKSPAAVARELGVGVGALNEWMSNSRTIPRSKAVRVYEVAKRAEELPAATAKEIKNVKLDAELWAAVAPPALPEKEEPPAATWNRDWPRAIRLFLRLKKTSLLRLELLTGIDESAFSKWGDKKGDFAIRSHTAAKLEAACKRHRKWKRAQKRAASAAGTVEAAQRKSEDVTPSPLSIPQEETIMQETKTTNAAAARGNTGSAADAAEIVRLKDENAALKRMVNELTEDSLSDLKLIREFARRMLLDKEA